MSVFFTKSREKLSFFDEFFQSSMKFPSNIYLRAWSHLLVFLFLFLCCSKRRKNTIQKCYRIFHCLRPLPYVYIDGNSSKPHISICKILQISSHYLGTFSSENRLAKNVLKTSLAFFLFAEYSAEIPSNNVGMFLLEKIK